jgi:antitoxin (DNA-binding transcriptional repressor) of toxin-antitoxin stability system
MTTPPRTISSAQFLKRPRPILDAVRAGETIILTRYDEPVAVMSPPPAPEVPESAPAPGDLGDSLDAPDALGTTSAFARDEEQ